MANYTVMISQSFSQSSHTYLYDSLYIFRYSCKEQDTGLFKIFNEFILLLLLLLLFAFKQQNSISHSSGSWESKIRLPAWLGSGEDPLQVQTASFL